MGGLPGLSGIADVQARIASIQARFAPAAPAPPTTSSTTQSAHPDFASLLEQASATSSANPTSSSPTAVDAQRATFARDLLASIGAPQTAENVRAITAWAKAEGTDAAFNPLATTRKAANTTDFNSVGVKNYPTYAEGVQATADTLNNGRYSNILAALASGTSAQDVARAIAASPWGTGNRVLQVLGSN